jgi:hypothetical protein
MTRKFVRGRTHSHHYHQKQTRCLKLVLHSNFIHRNDLLSAIHEFQVGSSFYDCLIILLSIIIVVGLDPRCDSKKDFK